MSVQQLIHSLVTHLLREEVKRSGVGLICPSGTGGNQLLHLFRSLAWRNSLILPGAAQRGQHSRFLQLGEAGWIIQHLSPASAKEARVLLLQPVPRFVQTQPHGCYRATRWSRCALAAAVPYLPLCPPRSCDPSRRHPANRPDV